MLYSKDYIQKDFSCEELRMLAASTEKQQVQQLWFLESHSGYFTDIVLEVLGFLTADYNPVVE